MEKGQENNQIDEEDDSNNVTNTKMENHPKDKKGLETESTEIEEKGDQSPGTARNKEVNPGDIKDPKTAEKEIDKTSGDKASPATANESESMPEENTSPGTAANTLDDPGDIKDPKTANTAIDRTSLDNPTPTTANERENHPEDKNGQETESTDIDGTSGDQAPRTTSYENAGEGEDEKYTEITQNEGEEKRDQSPGTARNEEVNPGDIKDPKTAEKEIDKTSGEKASPATANESDMTSGDNTPPNTANKNDGTDENKSDHVTTANESVDGSKCLQASPENENQDSAKTLQSVINTNEVLLTELDQIKQKLKTTAHERDEKEKGIAELLGKDVESQTIIFDLQEKLEAWEKRYKDAMTEKDAKLCEMVKEGNQYRKKEADNVQHVQLLQKRINELKKQNNLQEEMITKQKYELKDLNGTRKQVETNRKKYEKEIKHLNSSIATLNARIKESEGKHKTELNYLTRDIKVERQNFLALSEQYNGLLQRLETSQGEVRSLTEEKTELLLRLSKVAGANLTYNNPNIADLSDEKRPTKLAECFSELYDNEWTDVFEELDFETEEGKTNFMLDILMKTNAICSDLSNGHTKRIKDAFCRLTTTSHNTLAYAVKQSRVDKNKVIPTDYQKDKSVGRVDKKEDMKDSVTETESTEMSGQRRENDLEEAPEAQHDDADERHEEMTVRDPEPSKVPAVKHDSIDQVPEEKKIRIAEPPKKSELEDANTDTYSTETNDETEVETPKPTMDESTTDQLNTVHSDRIESKANKDKKDEEDESSTGNLNTKNADQNESMANQDEKNEATEVQHDSTDKGHKEGTEGKTKPSKDESTACHLNTVNADKKEIKANKDNNDEKSELEHANPDENPEEKNDETEVETPEPPIVTLSNNDESTAGHLNTVNADQNESFANNDKKDKIPEAKHDSIDKEHKENEERKAEPPKIPEAKHDSIERGHEENEEGKSEPPKDESTPGNLNLKADKIESKANKDKNEKSKLKHDNMDKNPEKNKDETKVETSEPTITLELQHDNTDKPPEQNKEENQVETPGSPKDKTDNDALEAPEATNSPKDDVTETETEISIESNFELLQKEQKKTIMDAKNFFENQLAKEVETTVADIIGEAFHTDSEKTTLKIYIAKCVNICWSMYRHNPPVFIEFPDLKESTPFDTNKFKPYTSSGKFIDYIVWPALYLHEKGPLLCKGVAQGLGNKKSK